MSKKMNRDLMRRLEEERLEISRQYAQKMKYHHAKSLIKLDKAVTEGWWLLLATALWAGSVVAADELNSPAWWDASAWFFLRATGWQGMKIVMLVSSSAWHHIRFKMTMKAKKRNDDA